MPRPGFPALDLLEPEVPKPVDRLLGRETDLERRAPRALVPSSSRR